MNTDCTHWRVVCFTFFASLFLPAAVFAGPSPSISTQPQNQSIVAGSNAVFTVTASGSLPLSYQWSFNGTNLSNNSHVNGATNTMLTISNVMAGDAGNYKVVVTNSHGHDTSSNATLTVLLPPNITNQPAGQSVPIGGNVTFTVAASGMNPLTYQWYFSGTPLADSGRISGSGSASLTISDVQLTDAGGYFVVVSNSFGISTSSNATLTPVPVTHYVNVNGVNPISPFTSWNTAATDIQDAVNAANAGDSVLVTNGDYQVGSTITADGVTNRVITTNAIALLSVNGPAATTIDGVNFLARPAYLADGSSLSGFTVTGGNAGNGPSPANGGGVYCASTNVIITNCVFVGNQAFGQGGGVYQGTIFNCTFISNGAAGFVPSYGSGGAAGSSVLYHCFLTGNTTFFYGEGGGFFNCLAFGCTITNNFSPQSSGGGAYLSTLYNCLVVNNFAESAGGGAEGGTLNNCTVVGNATGEYTGGGADSSALNNCIVYYNSALIYGSIYTGTNDVTNYFNCTLNNCCTTPLPTNLDNVLGPPSFVNMANDWHLQSNSPCINEGDNNAVVTTTDFDGNPRIYGPFVDIGAYEYSAPTIDITSQPFSQTVLAGQTAQFNVVTINALINGYQWYFNGTPLTNGGRFSGSTTASLIISNVQPSDAGNYWVVVTNISNFATSAPGVLTVISIPALTAPFSNQVTMVFSNVTLSLSVTGAPPMSFQWLQNGTPLTDGGNISGSSGPNLSISDPQMASSGQYSVIVSNSWGAITNTATLTVVPVYDWGDSSALLTPPGTATNVMGIASAGQVVNADFAVRGDGSVIGWGNDLYGVLDIPSNATNVLSLMAGDEQVIAIRQDGTVVSWGYGGTNVPPNATNVEAVAIQNYGGCLALRQDGSIVTWNGATPPPANVTNVIAIGAGAWGSCLAVLQNGTVVGWGDDYWGETSVPAQATNVFAVACGDRHSLALRADGTIVGFGLNANGQSIAPANATNVTAIAAGQDVSLALHRDGTVVSWGLLGINTPAFVTNGVAIAARYYHSVVLVQDPTVTAPPQILQQPLTAVTQTNQTLILEGQAVGAALIQYQWYFNGAPLPSQTNRWLLLSPVQTSQGGNYQFVAANNFGSVTSSPAIVWTPPAIPVTPAATIVFGSNGVFTVAPIGTTPFGYQWSFNGTPLTDGGGISGSAAATLTIANFQPANLGNYTVTVTNLAGSATSTAAIITVLNPLVTSQPPNQSVLAGTTVNIGVTATGQQPLSFQWQYNGSNLPGATSNPLVLSNVLVSQSGTYSVTVSNSFGTVTSSNATLTVTAISIVGQPLNQSVLGGTTVNFSVSANGQQPFAYQWLYNGTNLPGATSNPLVLTNVLVSQSGLYSVIITNAYGMAVSSNATLTVSALAFITQPTNRITWPNGPATFKATVSGIPPFTFDWQCNGVDVPGTWSNILTLTNVPLSQFGSYHVIVSNSYGSATSTNATLLLSQVAVWGGFEGESNLAPGLTNIIAIAGSGGSTVDCFALKSNGIMTHWPSPVHAGASNILAVAAGTSGSPPLLLKTNGTIIEWLVDDLSEPITGFTNIVAIAPNTYNTLTLTSNGTVVASVPGAAFTTNMVTNAVAIAEGGNGPTGGFNFSLALKADGTVKAWGNGPTNVPSGLSNVIAIAAGTGHCLALKGNGTVVAWGSNSFGQTNVPASLSNVVAIAAGGNNSLALRANGTVAAWGYNFYGQTNVPVGLTNVIAIAAGANFSMALIGNGPPVLSVPLPEPVIGTNGFSVPIPSQSGRVYVLEYTTSLSGPNWISLPLVPGNGGTIFLTDPSPIDSQRFYRVQRW